MSLCEDSGTARGKISSGLDPACTPEDIEKRSFAIIDSEVTDKYFSGDAWEVARRLIHTSGDISLLDSLYLPDDAIRSGVNALKKGAPVFTDTEMARSGIPLRRLQPLGSSVSCILSQKGLAEHAAGKNCTRSRAAMEFLGSRLAGAVVAIGNAPTALLALLEYMASGGIPPALVIGMPVGFVNAAESKELLLQNSSIPSLSIRGRRGGSPLAAATVNALAIIAEREITQSNRAKKDCRQITIS